MKNMKRIGLVVLCLILLGAGVILYKHSSNEEPVVSIEENNFQEPGEVDSSPEIESEGDLPNADGKLLDMEEKSSDEVENLSDPNENKKNKEEENKEFPHKKEEASPADDARNTISAQSPNGLLIAEILCHEDGYKFDSILLKEQNKPDVVIPLGEIFYSGDTISIRDFAWLDNQRLVLAEHVNPSLGSYTIINAGKKEVIGNYYGINFTWNNKRDKLYYVQTMPHFSTERGHDKIVDDAGNIYFETPDRKVIYSDLFISEDDKFFAFFIEDADTYEQTQLIVATMEPNKKLKKTMEVECPYGKIEFINDRSLKVTTSKNLVRMYNFQKGYLIPDDAQVKSAYKQANEAFYWFEASPMPTEPIAPEKHPGYLKVKHETIKNFADLENYLLQMFSADIVQRLLTYSKYAEFDNALYALIAESGARSDAGGEEHQIIRESEEKIIYRVILEILDTDPEVDIEQWEVIDYETYNFAYEYLNGKWVFTNFCLVGY